MVDTFGQIAAAEDLATRAREGRLAEHERAWMQQAARNAVVDAQRTLVWPEGLIAESRAERWLKAKCEKRARRAAR